MPLQMNRDVFITCAVTGSGGTQDKSNLVPRTPEQIAESAIDAAKAGAAIVHCHVRDPETGVASRRVDLYREVTDRIRDSDTDVVLNLTAGMGGDLILGPPEAPLPLTAVASNACSTRLPSRESSAPAIERSSGRSIERSIERSTERAYRS